METGLTYTAKTKVTTDKLACSIGSGDLQVLGTPAMVACMENAALLCVAGYLSEGCTTVGSHIDCSHLRPSAEGSTIEATATLTAIVGRKLTFHITASDEQGTIGEATHERYIVERQKFMAKL